MREDHTRGAPHTSFCPKNLKTLDCETLLVASLFTMKLPLSFVAIHILSGKEESAWKNVLLAICSVRAKDCDDYQEN